MKVGNSNYQYITRDNVNRVDLIDITLIDVYGDTEITLHNIYPESISVTPMQSTFSPIDFSGRTPGSLYKSISNRKISFPFELYCDTISSNSEDNQINKYKKIINILESLNVPQYTSVGIIPAMVYLKIGKQFAIKGEYSLENITYSGVIRQGIYTHFSSTISINEVLDKARSSQEILDNEHYTNIDY